MLKTVDMRESSARQVEQILTEDDVDAVIVLQPEVNLNKTAILEKCDEKLVLVRWHLPEPNTTSGGITVFVLNIFHICQDNHSDSYIHTGAQMECTFLYYETPPPSK